jgi:hypothetical protein
MVAGSSSVHGMGDANSRSAMIDPPGRRTGDMQSITAIRARTTPQIPSHSLSKPYSQACSHRAESARESARDPQDFSQR